MTQIEPNVDAVEIITIERRSNTDFIATMTFREGKGAGDLVLSSDGLRRIMRCICDVAEAEYKAMQAKYAANDWQDMEADWMGERFWAKHINQDRVSWVCCPPVSSPKAAE